MKKSKTIPLTKLFGNISYHSPRLSADGRSLAYLAPYKGVLNLWKYDLNTLLKQPVTFDSMRGIENFQWAPDSRSLLYLQDKNGDENWELFLMRPECSEPSQLTKSNVQAKIIAIDPSYPNEILVGLNDRDVHFHDIYRLNIFTGDVKLDTLNEFEATSFVADNSLSVRLCMIPNQDGSLSLLHRHESGEWKELFHWSEEDSGSSGPIGFDATNTRLLFITSEGSNTIEAREYDFLTNSVRRIAGNPQYDISHILVHPRSMHVQAIGYLRDRLRWDILDHSLSSHFEYLESVTGGNLTVIDRDLEDATWLVKSMTDNAPHAYYLYQAKEQKHTFLFHHRPDLKKFELAKKIPISFNARDGLGVTGYVSPPIGMEKENLPTVLIVHGGPWDRDNWSFDTEVQFLANRGYAVLQINYRGSMGFGKQFMNAGDREWGGKMQDDLTDGVKWLITEGIADPARIAIYGGSYGGYAALWGLVKTPELYRCGISMCGPSSLISFIESIPAYWQTYRSMLERRIGSLADIDFLKSRSPLYHASSIKVPVLIAQGANDPRVPLRESIQMRDAIQAAGTCVEYVEFTDEGHGFAIPKNRLVFYSKMEAFLATHLNQ